ncbi:class I SAM-dependent methyltransferase [Rhabdochromatium marinum]|uniref:class I SAM-dependent methyltransferase n=1 Tax=Rhabdochromatium marinum TaxID=48729 RepID=UPI0019062609|nr:class I SAM-dependent methyltransferase [Rhabdochromatium marinum]MBK1649864.1 hypothetical protein [Rhabdochromatium marinum]
MLDPVAPVPDDATAVMQRLTAFGLLTEDARPYFQTHFERYQTTLNLINFPEGIPNPRILELGGGTLLFTLLLKDRFPGAEIVIGTFDDEETTERCAHNPQTGETLACQAHCFNIEQDEWPLPDASFDLVISMEMLEHLLLDPCHVFREAKRILRTGGRFLVTTPNIACYESVKSLLNLETPYRFGIYSQFGPYGRHNREYTPIEVAELGEYAGFDEDVLVTHDVYPISQDTSDLRANFGAHLRGPDELRHQNIFYVGRKTDRPFGPYPSSLYTEDPHLHRARIAVTLHDETSLALGDIHGEALVTNLGGYTWTTAGEGYTRLRIALAALNGTLIKRDFHGIRLPGPIEPGQQASIPFVVAAPRQAGDYQFCFDMVHENVCWFSDGRTWPQSIAVRVNPA